MGKIIEGKCKICNFKINFNYGGNRLDYQTNYPVPAINIETGKFENINYKIEKNNTKYKFYTQEELKGNNEENSTIISFNLELNTLNNYCPFCKNYAFDFKIKSLTD